MKKNYNLLLVLIIPVSLILFSYHTGSPGGRTNSPGDGFANCTNCHTGNSLQSQSGWITSNIPPEGYTAGQDYIITATGTDPAAVRFGFELTAENSANSKIGTFSILEPNRTQFTNNSDAVTHTSNGITPAGGSNTWQVTWTAPESNSGQITFYAAFNAANGNGNSSGDQIYASTYVVNPYIPNPQITSVDPNHGEQGWVGEVTIIGNETSWLSGVFSVTFLLHENNAVVFQGSNINVTSNTELTVDIDIPTEQEIGLYDVKVNALKLDNAFTVDVASSVGEDLLSNSIHAFPNPTSSNLNLDLPEGAEYRLVSINGQLLISKTNTSSREILNMTSFESGLYFIQVINKGEIATKRILKN